jgi:hypothetical protein
MSGSDPSQGSGAQRMAGYTVEIINWHISNFIYRSFDHCELVRTCSSNRHPREARIPIIFDSCH